MRAAGTLVTRAGMHLHCAEFLFGEKLADKKKGLGILLYVLL